MIINRNRAIWCGDLPPPPRHPSPTPDQRATVAEIDWARLATPEARRLRELGFDQGVAVEVLHRARLGGGSSPAASGA
ncbi:FeoA domain-containing protein [Sphingomonas sp. MMS24-JH45]